MTLHRRFFDLISPIAEVFDFVRPDTFVFHCTLASALRTQDMPRALELACASELPSKSVVSGFEVVEYGTTKTPESFKFGTRNTTPNPVAEKIATPGFHNT